jgi:hypothetical protein
MQSSVKAEAQLRMNALDIHSAGPDNATRGRGDDWVSNPTESRATLPIIERIEIGSASMNRNDSANLAGSGMLLAFQGFVIAVERCIQMPIHGKGRGVGISAT